MKRNKGRVKESIAIIGEGETEHFYFDSLRVAKRYPFKVSPSLPTKSDLGHMLSAAEKFIKEQYDYVICLIDMDCIKNDPTVKQKYDAARKKRTYKDVLFIETSPCTEFWFLLHFLPDMGKRNYESYDDLEKELRKYIPGYKKTKNYFNKIKLYDFLLKNGSLERAMKNAQRLSQLAANNPDESIAYSEVYKVFEILDKLSNK